MEGVVAFQSRFHQLTVSPLPFDIVLAGASLGAQAVVTSSAPNL
jgi:hypothetical protein